MEVEEVITELSMTYSFSLHLVVEGDSDRKFFNTALDGGGKLNVVPVGGADRVVELMTKVETEQMFRSVPFVLGIIDRDYRIPLGLDIKVRDLMVTDLRDFECMMFASPSFHYVLSEFGSTSKIKTFGGIEAVKEAIVAAAKELGAVRYYSHRENLNLSFKDIDLGRLVDKDKLSIDYSSMMKYLNAQQKNGVVLSAESREHAEKHCSDAVCSEGKPYFTDDLLLCRGHDLMGVLSIGLRKSIGSRRAVECSVENLESCFRLSYLKFFQKSELGSKVAEWLKEKGLSSEICLT